jgi:hypothetical protein
LASIDKYFKARLGVDTPVVKFETASTTNINFVDPGHLFWNYEEGTLDLSMSGSVSQAIGMESLMPPTKNNSGVTINRGDYVMATGVQGDRLTIAKAINDGSIAPDYFIGVAAMEIINGAENGLIVTDGLVKEINTASWTVGTLLYPSPTIAGGLTSTKPNPPSMRTPVAIVVRQQANSGRILVRNSTGSTLGQSDSNVLFTSASNNDIILYNSSASYWYNQNLATAIQSVDGSGSGIDADLLDGQHGSYYTTASNIVGSVASAVISSSAVISASALVAINGGGGGVFPIWGERNSSVSAGTYFSFGNGANSASAGLLIYEDVELDGLSLKGAIPFTSDTTIEAYKNGVATAATLTVVNGGTQGYVSNLGVSFAPGDYFAIRVNAGGGGNPVVAAGWFLTEGAKGPQGPTGATGERGGVPYRFSTTTTDADPGTGFFRFDSGTPASITQMFISTTALTGGTDMSAWFSTWDDSTSTVKGYVTFRARPAGGQGTYIIAVTGAVTSAGTYYKVPVSWISGVDPIPNNANLGLEFNRTGDLGAPGAPGDKGDKGDKGDQGDPGVVAATAPVAYDSGTQTVSLNVGAGLTTSTGNLVPDFGTTSGKVAQGNDSRFTDARTPTAHASTHAAAGSDPVTLAQSQVTDLTTDLAAKISASLVDAAGDLLVGSADNTVGRLALGSDGQVLTVDTAGTGVAKVKWATASGGGGGMTLLDSQTFTSSTTYTMPSGAKIVLVEMIASGGGGGGGRRTTTGNAGAGGGGGGGMFYAQALDAAALGGSVTVTVGAGGTGGAGRTGSDGSGTAGNAGGDTQFGYVKIPGGRGGAGGGTGDTTQAAGYMPTPGLPSSINSSPGYGGAGRGSATGSAGGKGYLGGAGGGGGGGTNSSAVSSGGAGGNVVTTAADIYTTANNYTSAFGGGASGGSSGASGSNATNAGDGGGGGASSITATAGAGGNGAAPGGGGGGGGGASNNNGGNGGDGARGEIKIWVYG